MTPLRLSELRNPKFFLLGCPDRYTPGAMSEKLIGGTIGGSAFGPSSSTSLIDPFMIDRRVEFSCNISHEVMSEV